MTDESVERTLIYVGQRWNATKITNAWVRPEKIDDLLLWDKLRGGVVGGVYTVKSPAVNSDSVYPASLAYADEKYDDEGVVALWEVQDRNVRRQKQMQQAERRAAKSSPLDNALTPLLRLARLARTRADAQALAHEASSRVMDAYWKEH